MSIDLKSIGMEKGQQYETIITTENAEGIKNSAPIGVICKDNDEFLCRIFKGSDTLNNIILKKEFVVNITLNPILFTLSTINNVPQEYFTEESGIAILKDVDAYLKCEVKDIKKAIKDTDPVRKSEIGIITSKVKEIVLNNKCAKAPNRGFYSLIESLVNFTRIDIVDNQQQDYFLGKLKESTRIINKVGSSEDKKAIELLRKALKSKGYNIK
ncbi:hypothetical protein MBCUT_17950 [Methanobrevibacter cuticularis]|uniref:DUF447 family protein n=1 Tax=Methanobrevibacter cuticularis TaxID=47311 RepID=A0A166CYD6_9EURY|nr:DUF447 domain-containing protein [Methanobrevibacter cuticularis]KZX14993.1 hypothetical protein MBCUT_17950 [Methanobrevibacter cuticularis]